MMGKHHKRQVVLLLGAHLAALGLAILYASRYHVELHGPPSEVSLIPALVLLLSLPLALLFVLADFSFGYLVGFYLYQLVAGFLFLNTFIDRSYSHSLAAASALSSIILFLLPALFLGGEAKSKFVLSHRTFDRLLLAILAFAFVTVLAGAAYNFRTQFADLSDLRGELFTARLRNELRFPALVRYSIGIFSSALLPFAFSFFLKDRRYWRAAAALGTMALFFPITLSKTALLAPTWLVFVAVLSRRCEPRVAAIASLTVPLGIAVLSVLLLQRRNDAFDLLAFRMFDIPSAALAIYNEFFADHPNTYFCQLSFAKWLMPCPYEEQLGIVMAKAYGLGNYNASLFATEGIASLGPMLAPLSALACGLIIALGNRASARLSSETILVSSSVLCQAILNVPLSTALLSHGGALLFLLWYVAPRRTFPRKQLARIDAGAETKSANFAVIAESIALSQQPARFDLRKMMMLSLGRLRNPDRDARL